MILYPRAVRAWAYHEAEVTSGNVPASEKKRLCTGPPRKHSENVLLPWSLDSDPTEKRALCSYRGCAVHFLLWLLKISTYFIFLFALILSFQPESTAHWQTGYRIHFKIQHFSRSQNFLALTRNLNLEERERGRARGRGWGGESICLGANKCYVYCIFIIHMTQKK